MLLPQMIGILNRNHAASITHLEGLARDIHALQQLADTLAGSVTHINAIGGGFTVFLTIDIYWSTHPAELAALLHDYHYSAPVEYRRALMCLNERVGLALSLSYPATQAAA